MPFAGNFHPEWGYLAPAPSFMRTARIVAVATAIGATAGAAVVLSLAGRPAPGDVASAGKTFVVVHSLVQPAEAAVPSAASVAAAPMTVPAEAPPAVQPKVQASIQPSAPPPSGHLTTAPATGRALAPAPSDSGSTTTPLAPASVAALAEIPPATEALPGQPRDQVMIAPDRSGVQKSVTQKPHADDRDAQRITPPNPVGVKKPPPSNNGLGGLLRHLFSARAGTSYYPN
jgi:hypothetical protein